MSHPHHGIARIWVALLATTVCGYAQAQFNDGNKLFNAAKDFLAIRQSRSKDAATREIERSYEFLGYVTGVLDADLSFSQCLPNITIGQAAEVAAKLIVDQPERRHILAATLVRVAVIQAFPSCKGLPYSPPSSDK